MKLKCLINYKLFPLPRLNYITIQLNFKFTLNFRLFATFVLLSYYFPLFFKETTPSPPTKISLPTERNDPPLSIFSLPGETTRNGVNTGYDSFRLLLPTVSSATFFKS